jgi:DNA uptake protein ComE-like DNA-binding protein
MQEHKINLNTCDSIELRNARISSVWANKILAYRKSLGGYYNTIQLLEIYNFPEFLFERIHSIAVVYPTQVEALGVNTKSVLELTLHPYISKKEAEVIVSYRNEHGIFNCVDDFLLLKALDSNTVKKIEPYLAKDFQSSP